MTLKVYNDWMDYTEPNPADMYGRIVPKKSAPKWVSSKIDEYYDEINSRYP